MRMIMIVLTLGLAAFPPAQAQEGVPSSEFYRFVHDGRTEMRFASLVLEAFDETLAKAIAQSGAIENLANEDLRVLAGDAAIANFYFPGSREAVHSHSRLFAELERRGIATGLEVDDYFRTLVAARRWSAARALAERFPELELERLPTTIQYDGAAAEPAYWVVDRRSDAITRKRLDLTGLVLVLISHPGCGFARAALARMKEDRVLRSALPERVLFIAPTFGGLGLDSIRRWNILRPDAPHHLVDKPLAWTFVERWNTPQFLFLFNGQRVAALEGWPGEDQASRLQETALRVRQASKAGNGTGEIDQ